MHTAMNLIIIAASLFAIWQLNAREDNDDLLYDDDDPRAR